MNERSAEGSGEARPPKRSVRSDGSDPSTEPAPPNPSPPPARPRRLRPSGGFASLRSFQVATIIYDATFLFCNRFVEKRSRTHDQMVQAARSGRQNISEGSRASATSSTTELHLVGVARSSLEELLLDYQDYLRQHHLRAWEKDDPEALEVRAVGRRERTDRTDRTDLADPTEAGDRARWAAYARWLEHTNPAIVANALVCLINQANYLLDQQLDSLERQFIEEGGYSEQLAAARIAERERQRTAPSAQPTAPACPLCGKPLVLRTARKGKRAGSQFWGCSQYPACKGTRPL